MIDIILPTGAKGNIAGGYMAKCMGIPLGTLCAGVNANDITHRVVETGQFYKSDVMLKTLSDAINIQVVRKARMIEAFVRVALFWCGFDRHVIILFSFHISFSFGRANGWFESAIQL